MKKFFIIIFGLLFGAVIIVGLVNFVKPKAITDNKSPVVTQPTPTPSTSTPTPTTPTPTTPAPTTVQPPAPAQVPKLTDKPWHWVNITYSNGTVTTPRNPAQFVATFSANGGFGTGTDCNSMGGTYKVAGNTITFSQIFSTARYCAGSQESEYGMIFGQAQTYSITKSGELRIDMKFGAGYALFQ